MKQSKRVNSETALFESVIAELKVAEKVGDVAEQESLHAELSAFAMSSRNSKIRKAASELANGEMADMSCYRGFVEQITDSANAGNAIDLERTYLAFAEFGSETTNPTVRMLVAEALAERRNVA
ncbi:hypothetical protein NKI12_02325 [Mesorhizobium australicum]|uniref:Uncharacterized protein n=1 Tax=Mesorhizobium australicum TaxID=536018 RepID=A0ACC6SVL0_9HYPH